MKLLTAIFFAILLAFSGVSAQNRGLASEEIVLAEGGGNLTAPMIGRVIDFFEWSLEVKLSDAERTELQAEIVENWKQRNCREIEGVRRVLRLADDRQNWDAEELSQLRELYKNRFLNQLAQTQSNKINSLILSGFAAPRKESSGGAIDFGF